MRIALAQINSTIGDFAGNEAKILQAARRAEAEQLDLVLFPELTIPGYPPRDLLLKKDFIAKNLASLQRLAAASGKTALMVGYAGENKTLTGRPCTNEAALLQGGKITAARLKTLLPTYDVFDEDRYFEPGKDNLPADVNGHACGLSICEDIWNDEDYWPHRLYRSNPIAQLVAAGAEVILNISASPWTVGKEKLRQDMLASLARKSRHPVLLCNMAGGNDELIFDGSSMAFNAEGGLIARARSFEEDFVVVDTAASGVITPPALAEEEAVYKALVLGLRDYMQKCGFKSAVIGLSGGIDSSLVACLAVEALGAKNVRGVSLPSRYSSPGSLEDARLLAGRLGIAYDVIPIEPPFASVREQLQPVFRGLAEDTTEENIQARLRGVILMALSNKFGSLVLTTGNKSELAVGYCTLYGDMCGGLAVISDVPKTMVYRLARWINRARELIPKSSLTKPPSAELRPNQTDLDSLPPYETLDAILEHSVVGGKSLAEIVALGYPEADVRRVVRLIELNEYKRRQAAPGLKVTTKAFGVGRRIPIAQRYREG
ncbi:MAG TPA: NAD+ synthase, partial [Candidatus Acidoferrum sp.]|nr:NAD+ synthase [Candidatus Acidoferrum sp.]